MCVDQYADVNELAKEQSIILVAKMSLYFDCSGDGINLIVGTERDIFVQLLRTGSVPGFDPRLTPRLLCLQHGSNVVFRQRKYQVDGTCLCNNDDSDSIAAGYLVTDIGPFQADTTTDRYGYPAPVELQLSAGNASFIRSDCA